MYNGLVTDTEVPEEVSKSLKSRLAPLGYSPFFLAKKYPKSSQIFEKFTSSILQKLCVQFEKYSLKFLIRFRFPLHLGNNSQCTAERTLHIQTLH